MLSISELPLHDGVPQGRYRLKLGNVNDAYPGVRYENGVSAEPVEGRAVIRQHSAFGPAVVIEAWDEETLSMVIAHLRATGRSERADQLEDTSSEQQAGCNAGIDIEDINEMPKEDLLAFLKKLGVKVAKNMSESTMREKIARHFGVENG